MKMFEQMLALAKEGHKNQKRHNGEDFINHPVRVSKHFKDILKRTVSVGHDLPEDHPEYELIIKREFPKEVYEGIMIVTRRENENYFEFIMRIRDSGNITAISVKIADLQDNMNDHKEGSKKDKYRFALYILENFSLYKKNVL